MIKFFRRIGQRLHTESRFSKYTLFAIDETVLVVIGIIPEFKSIIGSKIGPTNLVFFSINFVSCVQQGK
ncbi:MAG: hypothetical protein ACJAQ4_001509 [Cryomorphaceae bacterium]|jgi:hypothetical protein